MYDPTEIDNTPDEEAEQNNPNENRLTPSVIANAQRLLMSDVDTESTADDGYGDENRTAQSVTPNTGNTPTTSHVELNPAGDQIGTSPIPMFKRPRENSEKSEPPHKLEAARFDKTGDIKSQNNGCRNISQSMPKTQNTSQNSSD